MLKESTMTINQIYWAVSFVGLFLTFLIIWFIIGRMNRFGFGAYKWVIYSILLVYAGKEIYKLGKSGDILADNPFFWFWMILGIASIGLLILDWKRYKKKGVTGE